MTTNFVDASKINTPEFTENLKKLSYRTCEEAFKIINRACLSINDPKFIPVYKVEELF